MCDLLMFSPLCIQWTAKICVKRCKHINLIPEEWTFVYSFSALDWITWLSESIVRMYTYGLKYSSCMKGSHLPLLPNTQAPRWLLSKVIYA